MFSSLNYHEGHEIKRFGDLVRMRTGLTHSYSQTYTYVYSDEYYQHMTSNFDGL